MENCVASGLDKFDLLLEAVLSLVRVRSAEYTIGICFETAKNTKKNKKISNDQELIQSDPISCPQNQKGNN